MSHNKIKVGTQEPDANGSITVGLNDLSDVTLTSPAVNQMLKYNGSGFVNGATEFTSDLKFGFVANTTATWSATGNYDVGDYSSIRYTGSLIVNDTGYTQNNSTSTNTVKSNSNWFESVDIPNSGKYLFIVCFATFGSGNGEWRFSNNAGEFGAKSYIHHDNIYGSVMCGIADCVANDVFRLILKVEEGGITLFDEPETRGITFQIYKIG